jgi:hypothetical protein
MSSNEFSRSLLVGGLDTIDDADDDDDDLETFMTGLSMSRTALRRDGGVASVGRVDMDLAVGENNVPSPNRTPGRWSGVREGTSSPSSGYVSTRAKVRLSPEGEENKIPRSVSIHSGPFPKRYKLYQVPKPGKGFEDTCFSLIGQGTTFCSSRKCKTSHQGDIFSPLPDSLFVAKTPTTAFADPKSSVNFLTPDLLVSWNSNACPLEEWSRLFMLVNSTVSDGPTSAAILEAKEDFAVRAEAHRTPGKRKADPLHLPMSLRASPYTRQLAALKPDEESPFILGSGEALEVLRHLDEGLEKATNYMADLSDEQGAFAKEENLALRALEHKVGDLKREIGTRPEALSVEYNAPTMWGSIGAIGSHLDTVAQGSSVSPKKLVEEVRRAMDPVKDQLLEAVSKKTAALETRINKIKMFALNSSKHLQQVIEGHMEDVALNEFSQLPPLEKKRRAPSQTPGAWAGSGAATDDDKDDAKPEWVHDVIKSFESRIEDLSTRLSKVTAETDEQAVWFSGLGFRLSREANAWLVCHLPAHHCGLIVDVHVVLEHIQAQSFGQDSIKTLESLIKLKIKTMADGLAMTSFEQKMPRFFKKSTSHKVVKDEASHFDTVVS